MHHRPRASVKLVGPHDHEIELGPCLKLTMAGTEYQLVQGHTLHTPVARATVVRDVVTIAFFDGTPRSFQITPVGMYLEIKGS